MDRHMVHVRSKENHMTKPNRVSSLAALAAMALALLDLTPTAAYAELLVEEQFIYDLQSLIDGQDGGSGFDGPWRASKSHGRDYVMQFEGLTFTDANFDELPVDGNSLSRFGSAGRAEAHRLLSSAAQAALTGDDTTIWFSVLVAAPSAHRWGSFHFGTYRFSTQGMPVLGDGDDDRNPPYTPQEGEGFGFTLMTADSGAGDGTINALAFDDSSSPIVAAGTFTQPIQPGATHHDVSLIAGKIKWRPDGTPDELYLFNVTDLSVEPAEEEAIASIIDVDLDQSAFNAVAVWDTNNTIFDEIRFGTTFLDVVGVTVCPGRLSASGGADGVTLTWVNGLEMPTSVRILRDTQEIARTAPVDPPTYMDAGASPGLIEYELIFTMPTETCEPITKTFDACITDLASTRTEAGVVLTWTNNLAYAAIEIRREGEVLEASLAGTAETYTDAAPPLGGVVSYTVVPTNGTCDPTEVMINLNCEIPAPTCDIVDDGAAITAAFAFGVHPNSDLAGLTEWCETPNDPGTPYTAVEQTSPDAITYDAARGWGFEAIYTDPLDQPFGARGGYEIFGPFDNTANDRNTFATTCDEELYNSFIASKDFTFQCDETVTGDPTQPCSEADPGLYPPEGIIFRVDVPNGTYRFVGAFGSADNHHAHRILAEDGGEGPPEDIGPNHVTLVRNFDQAQYSKSESQPDGGNGVFARVGFNGRTPPIGDGIAPDPQFVNMNENGEPTPECASSPELTVTQGSIRFHALQANSNSGCGGTRDPNGGDFVILELWSVGPCEPVPEVCDNNVDDDCDGQVDCDDPDCTGQPPCTGGAVFKRGDSNGDGGVNIADAVFILQNLFANGPAIECMDAGDSNDDEGVNIADAVYILQNLFASGPPIPPPGPDTCGADPAGDPDLGCVSYTSCR